jgi:hypothetical protein
MTKSRAIVLTEAQRDSHRETMNIHRATATRLEGEGDFTNALAALKLALPHANALQDKSSRSAIFSRMNTFRAKIRTAKPTANWMDAPIPSTDI